MSIRCSKIQLLKYKKLGNHVSLESNINVNIQIHYSFYYGNYIYDECIYTIFMLIRIISNFSSSLCAIKQLKHLNFTQNKLVSSSRWHFEDDRRLYIVTAFLGFVWEWKPILSIEFLVWSFSLFGWNKPSATLTQT